MTERELGLITFELREVRLRIDDDNAADIRVRVSASFNGELHWINASGGSFVSPVTTLQKGDDGQLQACLETHDRAVISLSRDVMTSMANASVLLQLRRGEEGEVLLATGSLPLLQVLVAPNVNLNKRVQLQPHESSPIRIAEGSCVECKVFADPELASFVLGGDFYRCVSVDVFGVLQSWIEAATPQPPIIEQQFILETLGAERGQEPDTEESQLHDLSLMVPTTPGVLTTPTEQQANETNRPPAVHFEGTPYRFVHRKDLDAFRKQFGQGTAQLRLKHVLLSAPATTDKKKSKKNDVPPVETVTYYTGEFAPNMEQFSARDVTFDLVLKRQARTGNDDAAQSTATDIEEKQETPESLELPMECITVKLVYSMRQIWSKREEPIQVSKSLEDVLPASTRSRPAKQPRDVDQELRFEIKDVISLVATEYTRLFAHNSKLTKDEKKAKLLHHLSVSGIYHSFKEKLKPRISRVVRKKFGPKQQALEATTAAEAGESQLEFDEFLSKLYVHLLNESTSVLNAVYRDTLVDLEECDVYDAATISEDRETCNQKLARLQRWAMDAESAGRHDEAIKILMDRVNAALDDRRNDPELVCVEGAWMDLAAAHLRLAKEGSLEAAQACLIEAVSAHARQQNLLLLASTYLEQGLHEKAAACLFPDVWAAQSEEYQISALNPTFHVARCLCFQAANELGQAGASLQAAVKAHLSQRLKPEMHEQGRPRRTAVCVLLQTAWLYTKLNLFALARQAFDLAEQSEDACRVKAQARNMLVEAPAFHLQLMRRVQACLARQSVDADSTIVVETLLREALLYDVSAAENANCWIELGDFLFEIGDKQRAVEAYKKAINIHADQEHGGDAGAIQLRTYYRAGLLLLELGDHSGAQSIFLTGCSVHNSALLWLGAGVSFLRQEMWKDAEKAIMEASRLDHTDPQIWGFFALLCLCSSTQRDGEAQQCIAQAFRRQLTDVGLLKELALENIAVGKLQTAEDLLRRALGVPERARTALSYAQPTSRAMLRKLLADCLSGQHRAADAVDEYQKVASDPNATQQEQIEALSKCVPLLTTLGREEELASVEQSLQMLRAVAAAH